MRQAAGIALCAALGCLEGNILEVRHAAVAQVQEPVFRAATQLIEIDAHVTDKDGRFIAGLSRDDFNVLEDGTRQQIQLFSFVTIPAREDQIGQRAAGPILEQVASERVVAGRTYVMLLDGPAASADHVLRMQATARVFLDQLFGPADQMAVTFVKGKFLKYVEGREEQMVEQPFTTNRLAIEAAVERLAPDTRGGLGVEGTIRTYEAIKSIADQLGAIDRGRKILVWIGGQVPFNPTEGAFGKRAAEIAFAYRDAIRAANRHNVVVYTIDLLGLTTRLSESKGALTNRGGEELKRMAALRAVAEDTGGEAIVGTNNYADMFQQIAARSNAYYLLGYQAQMRRCDGRFHAITVRVRRAGASVRARKGYFAPEICQ
jgi:VWFA-related protein